ncbi:MAG: DsrE family protein [Parcubacteria group bacterium GW2011_GWA2_47_8b]|nr:MAG: DsrE family protein [Parcubacteria group bacterium GW2011_GWA2_47_8b]
MKIGIILQSNKPEHVWNTLRLAIASLKAGHLVQIFLFSEGVEAEDIADTKHFDISKKLQEFKDLKGIILACETCLNVRSKSESKICPVTTMKDLVKMIEDSDKVLVFG